MASELMIYGANGYTGALTAELAAQRGLKPVLAGRSPAKLEPLAARLGCETRAFSLDRPAEIDAMLRGVRVVLHCAGPFSRTAQPMVEACLRTSTHYLDITGEIEVFESLARRDSEAKRAGVMLLPGAGFDVVPSDCLAAHLKRRLPSASRLALAFHQVAGRTSRGTATTMAENLHKGGAVRRGGVITRVPASYRTRSIDFGRGPKTSITIPWGDVSTAWYSTGIPDIEVYMAAPAALRAVSRASRYLGWFLGSAPVQRAVKAAIARTPEGPSPEERSRSRSLLWGQVEDAAGQKRTSRMQAPESYTLTALTSLAIVHEVLAGAAPVGFQTPSLAYGADFVLGIEGVERQDID